MTTLTDTSPEALRVLIDAYRRMPLERKWRLIGDAFCFARTLHASGMRYRVPKATDSDIRADWNLVQFGEGPWSDVTGDNLMLNQPAEHQQVIYEVLVAFENIGIDVAIGGSIASSLFGVPRYTSDADLTAAAFAGKESAFADQFGPDYYLSLPAIRDAIRNRSSFNIIHTQSGFKVDVFIQKARAFDQGLLLRKVIRNDVKVNGRPIATISPEDILLHKLEWFRLGGEISDRQWSDILGVLRVQAGNLDEAYLDQWAGELGVSDLLAKARADAVI